MKKLLALSAITALLTLALGCPPAPTTGPTTPGTGPTPTKATTKPEVTKPEVTKPEVTKPEVTKPVPKEGSIAIEKITDVTVKPGEEVKFTVKLTKKEGFDDEVVVTFKAPTELGKVDDVTIAKGKDSADVKFKAGDKEGDHTVTATAKGKGVKDATADVKVTVKK